MTLKDVIRLISRDEVWDAVPQTDSYGGYDIRGNSIFKINLCYMSEEETWIRGVQVRHPILCWLYDAEVTAIDPCDDETISVWIKNESFFPPWMRKDESKIKE